MKPPDRLALPVSDGTFCAHFGRASEFLLCDVEPGSREPGRTRSVVKPAKPGACETVPAWLRRMEVTTVLADGIGAVARHQLQQLGIAVVTGLKGQAPDDVLVDWLRSAQTGGENPCEPGAHHLRHCRGKTTPSS